MNAWTNLRLATIQADLTARRADIAAERSATATRTKPDRPAAAVPAPGREARPDGWPVSIASRS